ncbi:hypothetical protein C8R43DRAFT_1009337 [Mycena crocata]|nr:hypothetical protein C8R43DRAFT_1009337 [Mycena crocata]
MISFSNVILSAVCLAGSVVSATNIHVNKGCIMINGVPACAPASVENSNGTAIFFARFEGQGAVIPPGCQLKAEWPTTYGDIYFDEDNCLKDAQNQTINGQCCEARFRSQIPTYPKQVRVQNHLPR